jgi:spectinomycin phosphotransferase
MEHPVLYPYPQKIAGEQMMLEKPEIQDEKITACLNLEYQMNVVELAFLPLGADLDTAVYRAGTRDGQSYFVKLRRGVFNPASVVAPKFLLDIGIQEILAPLPTQTGRLWANLDEFKVILYPFIDGRNGYETDLLDHHWRELGAALKKIHAAGMPPSLRQSVHKETFTPRWRETVKKFLSPTYQGHPRDPVAGEVMRILKEKHDEIFELVQRADQLAQELVSQDNTYVLCHSDLHAGNVFIADNGSLYILDWDAPILAPKERDLMYAGGGQFGSSRSPQEEELLFYQGYGETDIDFHALAYYRCERIIEDLAIYCEQLLTSSAGGEDRAQSLVYFKSNFLPGGTIEIARNTVT